MDVNELAPDVSQAGHLADAAGSAELPKASIGVSVHPACEGGEVPLRVLASTIRGEAVVDCRWGRTCPGPLVADVGPQPRGGRAAGARREHVQRRVVGEDRLARQHVPADGVGERLQQRSRAPNPVGQGGALEVDALALEDLALAIERQVVGVLRHQHVGEKARTRPTALDRARGQRRLNEALAPRAGEPWPHDAVHDEPAGHVLQLLGDVLA
jgi:hypothetical protein